MNNLTPLEKDILKLHNSSFFVGHALLNEAHDHGHLDAVEAGFMRKTMSGKNLSPRMRGWRNRIVKKLKDRTADDFTRAVLKQEGFLSN